MQENNPIQPSFQQQSTRGSHGILLWIKILIVLIIVGGAGYYLSTKRTTITGGPDMAALNELLITKRDYQAAETLASQMEVQFPNNVDIKLIKGEAEVSMRQYDEALATYKQILAIDPSNKTALYYQDVIPKIKSAASAPAVAPQSTSITATDIESRLKVTFDHTILKFDSGHSTVGGTNIAESMNATYISSKSVQDIVTYLGKTLPPPLAMSINGPITEFFRTATTTDPTSYLIRVDVRDGKTMVTINYSKAKQ